MDDAEKRLRALELAVSLSNPTISEDDMEMAHTIVEMAISFHGFLSGAEYPSDAPITRSISDANRPSQHAQWKFL